MYIQHIYTESTKDFAQQGFIKVETRSRSKYDSGTESGATR